MFCFEGSADSEMIGDVDPMDQNVVPSAALDAARNEGVTELVLVGKIGGPAFSN